MTLKKWDELTSKGNKVVAVCGSDAHAIRYHLGPISKVIYPYEFHFRSINMHIIVNKPLTHDLEKDRRTVLDALGNGHLYIANDLPANPTGFMFSAQGKDNAVIMGDEVILSGGVTLQIKLPGRCKCRLIKDGITIKTWIDKEICTFIANKPGVYRVECYIHYLGKKRGYIYSNPIYVREKKSDYSLIYEEM